MCSVALPEMRRYRYADSLSTGAIAAGGTLGILIPPSVIFVLYGIMTEQSIGKLLLAGIIPGLVLTLLFMLAIALVTAVNPALGAAGLPSTWWQRLLVLKEVWEVLVRRPLFRLGDARRIGGLRCRWHAAFRPLQAYPHLAGSPCRPRRDRAHHGDGLLHRHRRRSLRLLHGPAAAWHHALESPARVGLVSERRGWGNASRPLLTECTAGGALVTGRRPLFELLRSADFDRL